MWEVLTVINLDVAWQYSPITDWQAFRIQHVNFAPFQKLFIAQAQIIFGAELYDFRRSFSKPELDVFVFYKPIFFTERRLAFRIPSTSTPWQIQVEAWTSTLAPGGVLPTQYVNSPTLMTPGTAYVAASQTLLPLTLPTSANIGQIISILEDASGGFRILQDAGQQIQFGSQATTIGVPGRIDSSGPGDFLELTYQGSGLWIVTNAIGNFLVA